MASTKWDALQNRFLKKHAQTGISVKSWCEKNNLNYSTARRHIKINTQLTNLPQHKASCAISNKKRTASLGNQNARTLGHYSEFITTDEDALRHESALTASLYDELALLRLQLSNLMAGIKEIEGELSVDKTTRVSEQYAKLQASFDVKVARIESLENSIINHKKIKVDIEKTIALTEKARLEMDKLRNSTTTGQATLTEIYEEILAMGDDGMMNTK